jgi:CheY-like chemotaxis protein
MTSAEPMNVLIVEDEVLLAAELGYLVEEVGCRDIGHAMDSHEALELACRLHPDLALVDLQLSDGPTGIDVARHIVEDCGGTCLFMTANVTRLPADFAGACGAIGKPYSDLCVKRALTYLETCLREGDAPGPPPLGFTVAPAYAARWGLTQQSIGGLS